MPGIFGTFQCDISFGKYFIILVKDFGQLLLVSELSIYFQDSCRLDQLFKDDHSTYNQFQEMYKLKFVQRQIGNSDRQQQFRSLLYHLYNGESTKSNWELLMM